MSLVQLSQQVERWWRAPRQGPSPHCDTLALTSDQLRLTVWIIVEHLDHSPMKYVPSMEKMEGGVVSVKHMFVECDTGHRSQGAGSNILWYVHIYVLAFYDILCMFAMRSQQKRMLRLSRWRIAARFCPHFVGSVPWAPGDFRACPWLRWDYTIQKRKPMFGSPMSLILFERVLGC